MISLDLKKEYKFLYSPSANKVDWVEVPALNFIMLDGAIEAGMKPGTSPLFRENMSALYAAAYTLKIAAKRCKDEPVDYPVMALEGLWWVDDGIFNLQKSDNWKYTLMIMQPAMITLDMFANALDQLRRKKGDLPAVNRLRLNIFDEGLCVQTMHIGPYMTEPETMLKMELFIQENGLIDLVGNGGKHHEIYMGDPRRADPMKLKTILRHPVARKTECL